ncbi:MAG: rhodanese-like domain-containing protein [Thermodesulfobacteriota bacterium]|nr:rhodanese-like domain-containing protein [Thermodesulfobacteriota bacterium]
MKTSRQIFFILFISIVLGVLNNTLNPYKISLTGKIKNADHSIDTIPLEKAYNLFISKKAEFVDARFKADYMAGHISGAINLPNDMFDQYYPKLADVLGVNDTLIIYCSGLGCHLSVMLAETLRDLGHTKILLFEEGFFEWHKAGYPIETGDHD